MTERNDYILGQDVTDIAKSNTPKDSAVVSVRLPVSEVARLERISNSTGKSMSQIVREAVAAYEVIDSYTHPKITIADVQGYTLSTGTALQSSSGREAICTIKPIESQEITV